MLSLSIRIILIIIEMEKMATKSLFAYQWMLLAFLLQVFLLSTNTSAAKQTPLNNNNKRNCSYSVTIETTCTKGSGTSDHVSLRFGDLNSNDIVIHRLNSKHMRQVDPLLPEVLDDVPRKPFQACIVDQFQVTGPCVESPVCYLYLKSNGDDDWRPGFAQVQAMGAPRLSSEYFYFRRFLPRNAWFGSDLCDTETTPFGVKYRRKVFVEKSV